MSLHTCTVWIGPWLFATSLDDLAHLGSKLVSEFGYSGDPATFTYHELDGPTKSYRYLISANNGRALERALVKGASRRLGRQINSINELPGEYYRVGPVEQFLMQSGKVYFRGLSYNHLHRLQEDEANLISRLCLLIRERDPDVIENHNIFGFDLPFLEQRASICAATILF